MEVCFHVSLKSVTFVPGRISRFPRIPFLWGYLSDPLLFSKSLFGFAALQAPRLCVDAIGDEVVSP